MRRSDLIALPVLCLLLLACQGADLPASDHGPANPQVNGSLTLCF